ncbi:MAG TPA: hemolysin III family protein [Chthonomonadaceae bacterium]|nr:hemolysin III family protein [Chthonomonadaceae bacterium]
MASQRTWIREPFCSLSHLVGAVLSVVALVVLVVLARGRVWHLVGFSLYGISLVLLYTVSTLYHGLPVTSAQIAWWNRLDYLAIFLLIAGTYAPICLICLPGGWGWSLLGGEYGLAALGMGTLLIWKGTPHWMRVTLYILMGWLAVLAWPVLQAVLPPVGRAWLVAGGVLYTGGCVIYATDRPHLWPGKFSAHDLWHLFVLAGSACHFVLMLGFVAPMG